MTQERGASVGSPRRQEDSTMSEFHDEYSEALETVMTPIPSR